MAHLVWACDLCWTRLLQQGARLHNAGTTPTRYCECCRTSIRPGGRVLRFLVPSK